MFAARNAFMTPPPGRPTIASLSPAGSNNGGANVTISGTNFVPNATTVRVGGNNCSVTVNSSTSLVASFPALGRGAYTVEVTTPSGSATSTYTYTWTPYISYITPNSVYNDYGSGYTIVGGNFSSSGAGSVYLSNGGYYGISVAADWQLSFNPGVLGVGSYSAWVTAPDGWSNSVGFSVVNYPAPSISGVSDGRGGNGAQAGSTITLSGSNFTNGTTSVSIGGTAVSASISASSISFSCPNLGGDGTRTITVTTSGSGGQSASTSVYFWASGKAASTVQHNSSGDRSVPGWVNFIDVICCGGGGGGGGGTVSQNGVGGGAGGWGGGTITRSSSGWPTSISYTVGQGGAGGPGNVNRTNGSPGGASSGGGVTGAGGAGGAQPNGTVNALSPGNFSYNGVTYTGGVGGSFPANQPTAPGGGGLGGSWPGSGPGGAGAQGRVWTVFRQ